MPSSQEPVDIADAPPEIVLLAKTNPTVTVNLRPDHWSAEELDRLHKDRLRQIRVALYHGLLMSTQLTDFLCEVKVGTHLAICAQETKGQIVLVTGTVKEIYWLSDDRRRSSEHGELYGVHAAIRLTEDDYKYNGAKGMQIWGNYVLAIAEVQSETPSGSKHDPKGINFIETVRRFGNHKQVAQTSDKE